MKRRIFFSLAALFLNACAHTESAPYELKLQSQGEDQKVSTAYFTESVSQQVKSRSFATEEESTLSFVEVKTYLTDSEDDQAIRYQVTTREKVGAASLQEMAFPEPGESIETVITPKAQVISVENYPKGTIFYVPSVSLPKSKVSVGDTWADRYEWVALQSGLPFVLDVVTIFKEVKGCGSHQCAVLEISGHTNLGASIEGAGQFDGKLFGTILMDLDAGQVIESEIYSSEKVELPDLLLRSNSCLVAKVSEEKGSLQCEAQAFEELTPSAFVTR